MGRLLRIRRVLVVAAAIVLLVGCAGASRLAPTPTSAARLPGGAALPIAGGLSWTAPSATRSKLLYLARYSYGDVRIYDSQTLALVGDLTGFTNPRGLAVDTKGNVYVTDQAPNKIFAFHRGATAPYRTLTDLDGIVNEVVVGKDGTLYVSNEYDLQLGNGNVIEYAPTGTKPIRKITDPQFSVVEDVGLDSKNNLYVTYDNQQVVGKINEYPPGSTVGKTLPISLKSTGGIEFDAADDLVVANPSPPVVKVFAQGSHTPKYEFAQNQVDPFDVALAQHGTRAFITDPFTGTTYEYALPSARLRHTISNPSSTDGVAVEQ